VPTLCRQELGSADGVARGAYVLADSRHGVEQLAVVLLASGSEVHIGLRAWQQLEGQGIAARLVSMPCMEWFRDQPRAYRDTVLPPAVTKRVAIEAGVSAPWLEWIGSGGDCISLEHFGASAPYEVLYEKFGLTSDRVVAKVRSLLDPTR
jgi:transketolase